jgi:xanthine dehydrogenase small subunit
VSLTQVETLLAQAYPDFTEVLRRFGSPPIRSTATLAGNIANGSPIGDTMPCLMALGASLVLRRGDKTRKVLLDNFYTGMKKNVMEPGEFIEAVELPKPVAGQVFRAHKVSKRFEQDISATCAAISYTLKGGKLSGVKLAYNGLAPSRPIWTRRLPTASPPVTACAPHGLIAPWWPATWPLNSSKNRKRWLE